MCQKSLKLIRTLKNWCEESDPSWTNLNLSSAILWRNKKRLLVRYHPITRLVNSKLRIPGWFQVTNLQYRYVGAQIGCFSRRLPCWRLYFLEGAISWWILVAWVLIVRKIEIDTVKTEIIEGDARRPKIHSLGSGTRIQRKKSSLNPQPRQTQRRILGQGQKESENYFRRSHLNFSGDMDCVFRFFRLYPSAVQQTLPEEAILAVFQLSSCYSLYSSRCREHTSLAFQIEWGGKLVLGYAVGQSEIAIWKIAISDQITRVLNCSLILIAKKTERLSNAKFLRLLVANPRTRLDTRA